MKGQLVSSLIHQQEVRYGDESTMVPPRGRIVIDESEKLQEPLPKGIRFIPNYGEE